MPVAEPLDDPRRLQIHEDRAIVRRPARGEHTDDPHLQRVNTGEVKQRLGRGDDGVTRSDPVRCRDLGTDDTLAEIDETATLADRETAEIEVVERGADDAVVRRRVAGVERNHHA